MGHGVTRVEDSHHPRGYRELRSPAALRDLTLRKVSEQGGKCYVCGEEFKEVGEITTEHIEPRGMGAAWRDDHESNIAASHFLCNREKGSQRNFVKVTA